MGTKPPLKEGERPSLSADKSEPGFVLCWVGYKTGQSHKNMRFRMLTKNRTSLWTCFDIKYHM
jgi:hypothetical protein